MSLAPQRRHDCDDDGLATRAAIVWGMALVLAIAGTQTAHAFAYGLVVRDPHERAELLSATGHGYLSYAPLGLALGFGVLAAVLLSEVSRTARSPAMRLRAWRFAFVAPVVFTVQEHLERLVHDGAFPLSAAFERTFVVGLALQLPFALAAYVVARFLLSAARVVRRLLEIGLRARLSGSEVPVPAALCWSPRARALALGYGERGPPSFA